MKPTKQTLSKNNGILDKLWRTVGKEHAQCEVCATLPFKINYTQLHPHHIVGRTNHLLRWDILNRIWLCPTHHVLGQESAHNNPLWFTEWLEKNKPKTVKYLNKMRVIAYKQWTLDELLNIHYALLELSEKTT